MHTYVYTRIHDLYTLMIYIWVSGIYDYIHVHTYAPCSHTYEVIYVLYINIVYIYIYILLHTLICIPNIGIYLRMLKRTRKRMCIYATRYSAHVHTISTMQVSFDMCRSLLTCIYATRKHTRTRAHTYIHTYKYTHTYM